MTSPPWTLQLRFPRGQEGADACAELGQSACARLGHPAEPAEEGGSRPGQGA